MSVNSSRYTVETPLCDDGVREVGLRPTIITALLRLFQLLLSGLASSEVESLITHVAKPDFVLAYAPFISSVVATLTGSRTVPPFPSVAERLWHSEFI